MDDALGGIEDIWRNDRLESAILANPHIRRVCDAHSLQLERDAVVNVVANVFLVG